jgi:hypothetical protein
MEHDPLHLVSFEDILNRPLPPVDWLVEGLIARPDRVVVYGEFGSFKSLGLLDLSIALAAGLSWLGRFSVTKPQRVLYIDEEMGERKVQRLVKRLAEGANITEPIPLRTLSQRGLRFDKDTPVWLLSELERMGFDPDVIVVDALRRVLVGSENEAADVARFWDYAKPIHKAGKTLLLTHHMRKPGLNGKGDPRYRASGSTDILAGADVAFAFDRRTQDTVVVECTKSRNTEEPHPFLVSVSGSGDNPLVLRYTPLIIKAVPPTKAKEAADAVLGFLFEHPHGAAPTSEIKAHLDSEGIKEKTGERAIQQLAKMGLIASVGHGKWGLPSAAPRVA